ncbi:sigma-70 family RNA polymerase sigma factor [Bacillus sp. C30]|uniref:sigma-70 family RNA polymerase sigma factor n=1 Tax=Bacillus sp. C30 TaxID=1387733 RepID=UPI00349F78EF
MVNDLFEEKQHLVFAAIKQHFGSYLHAARVAEINNMELDDLIQVGRITLWELCLKYDQKKEETFNEYAVRHMKWRMSDEIQVKGSLIKMGTHVKRAQRDAFKILSIDLHHDEEVENDFFAVSSVNVEEEVINSIEFNKTLEVLNRKEKFILIQKLLGFTDGDIAKKLGICRPTLTQMKNDAFFKVNPNYKHVRKGLAEFKIKNHLRQQVI